MARQSVLRYSREPSSRTQNCQSAVNSAMTFWRNVGSMGVDAKSAPDDPGPRMMVIAPMLHRRRGKGQVSPRVIRPRSSFRPASPRGHRASPGAAPAAPGVSADGAGEGGSSDSPACGASGGASVDASGGVSGGAPGGAPAPASDTTTSIPSPGA